jgi:hypothetical protein
MSEFTHKLVAVLNKSIEPGKVMNALAHISVGLGAAVGKEPLRFSDYRDAEGGSHSFISEMPFMILSANSNKIKNLRAECLAHNIQFTDFTETMTGGTYQEQLARTAATKNEDLVYYGIALFGEWNKVSELTRKFSLWH